MTDRLNSSRAAMVDQDYYWRPLCDAPLGVKVQLLTGGGVAVHGKLTRRDVADAWYRGWTPLPKVPPGLR